MSPHGFPRRVGPAKGKAFLLLSGQYKSAARAESLGSVADTKRQAHGGPPLLTPFFSSVVVI